MEWGRPALEFRESGRTRFAAESGSIFGARTRRTGAALPHGARLAMPRPAGRHRESRKPTRGINGLVRGTGRRVAVRRERARTMEAAGGVPWNFSPPAS